ncbi:MAG TPA: FG-GAP repeat protein, partial [Polyangia bacterium]
VDQPPQLWILDGHGTGFDPRQTTAIDAYCDTLAVGDFNGDGYNDIACGSDGGTINLLINTP